MLPMEEARYRAKAVSWQLGEAGTGTPQVGVEFQIEDGEHKGTRISGYFALSDLAAEYTLQKLRNCGWTGTNILDLDDPAASASMAANVVELVCKPEDMKKDGKPVIDDETGEVQRRLRIQFVNRGGGLAMKSALGEDKKKVLAAQMKAKLAALDAQARKRNGGTAPSAGPTSPEPPPVTDDIPF